LRVVIKKNPEAFRRVRKTMEEGLALTNGDMAGPVLVILGQVHREQEKAIFGTEGRANVGGWPALSPPYAKKKRKLTRRRMLNLTGDMKSRFTVPTNPAYVQRFVPRGINGSGVFQFGAVSAIAAAHLHGRPEMAAIKQSGLSRKIFGGIARRLPVRDMISKTAGMVSQMNVALSNWYAKRVQQVLRGRK
jgi:hypothetical protein